MKRSIVVLFAGVSASVIAIFILYVNKMKTFNENDGPRISKDQHVQVDQQLQDIELSFAETR